MIEVPKIRKLVIVGGGTAGWMAAAALAKSMGTQIYDITLVESEEIGTVGVGEATIPAILFFNSLLGIDEDHFMRETNASIKLGIHFVNWRSIGTSYFHPFGKNGADIFGVGFYHYWLRMARSGGNPDYGLFNAETLAARANKYSRFEPSDERDHPTLNYAYQFDAALYAQFLRRYCETKGVVRKEGKIVKVHQDTETGFVKSVETDRGDVVEGDMFIDCSGFRGLLIEQTLNAGYEDWSPWLPCNRAAAVPCEHAEGPITPYTRSTAQEAGWQWRIPLQHRVGNGYVFCDEYLSEDEACSKLLDRLDGKVLKDPKILRFVTGHRCKMWDKNVVALGLASGFLEPLESTSIHLVQVGLTKLLTLMPRDHITQRISDLYNKEMLAEYIGVKDFLIAHYHVTEREDTPFWRYCKNMKLPDSLQSRLDLFKEIGHANSQKSELFQDVSWVAILHGQGLTPESYHPMADVLAGDDLKLRMAQMRTKIQDRLQRLSSHDDFLGGVQKSTSMSVA
jgi:tryptophan 7-halogenase